MAFNTIKHYNKTVLYYFQFTKSNENADFEYGKT